ncbi:MAG: radical SAM protein [Chlorobi bacterium]|nr:radical SAM protein [Chlorobiota bacterium]
MKNLLIISFDILKKNEPQISYSVASLIGYLKSKTEYNKQYSVKHLSINVDKIKGLNPEQIQNTFLDTINYKRYNFIAISVYVWSAQYINSTIKFLKNKGFNGKIILGGNEITYSSDKELKNDFPDSDIFIKSYAEEALYKILTRQINKQLVFNINVPEENLIPLYSKKVIDINENNKIRFETKRGCLFNCSFCAHKEKNSRKVKELNFNRVVKELKYLNSQNISKINILDPVFNTGNYIEVLEEMVNMNFKPKVSLQVRFELIKGEKGKHFLDLCEKLNVILEFGLQTIIEEEYKIIKRNNSEERIKKVLKELQKRNIDYETSLIYGLPNQTTESFITSINFLKQYGNGKITAFPLMLLKGTELYHNQKEWGLKEKIIGDYNLPYVVSGNSFTEDDYKIMEQIANKLNSNNHETINTYYRSSGKRKNINSKESSRKVR